MLRVVEAEAEAEVEVAEVDEVEVEVEVEIVEVEEVEITGGVSGGEGGKFVSTECLPKLRRGEFLGGGGVECRKLPSVQDCRNLENYIR